MDTFENIRLAREKQKCNKHIELPVNNMYAFGENPYNLVTGNET